LKIETAKPDTGL